MKKPFVFFDIDDTLLDARTKRIPESTGRALAMLHDAGFPLGVASGRNAFYLPEGIRELAPWSYYIFGSGHIIRGSAFEILYCKAFPEEVVRRCLSISEQTGVSLELKNEEGKFITREANESLRQAFSYFEVDYPPIMEYNGQVVTSMTCYAPVGVRVPEFDAYREIEMLYGRSSYCDIVLRGIDKVSAIRKILSWENTERFIAFGDSLNDLGMIRAADFGVAMGNGCEEIRAAASYVTAGVSEDGLMQAAEKILQMEW